MSDPHSTKPLPTKTPALRNTRGTDPSPSLPLPPPDLPPSSLPPLSPPPEPETSPDPAPLPDWYLEAEEERQRWNRAAFSVPPSLREQIQIPPQTQHSRHHENETLEDEELTKKPKNLRTEQGIATVREIWRKYREEQRGVKKEKVVLVTKAEKRLESESESLKKEPKPEQGIATVKEIWDQFTEGKKRIRTQTIPQEGTPKKREDLEKGKEEEK
jgi:hypothetical protein